MPNDLHIVYTPMNEILLWPRNPRRHALDEISASLTRFNFNDPITIDETSGHLIEGHGRMKALEKRKADSATRHPSTSAWMRAQANGWSPSCVASRSKTTSKRKRTCSRTIASPKSVTTTKQSSPKLLQAASKNLDGIGYNMSDVDKLLTKYNPDPSKVSFKEYDESAARRASYSTRALPAGTASHKMLVETKPELLNRIAKALVREMLKLDLITCHPTQCRTCVARKIKVKRPRKSPAPKPPRVDVTKQILRAQIEARKHE